MNADTQTHGTVWKKENARLFTSFRHPVERGKLVAINYRVLMRKSHRWGAFVIAVPFLVVIVTGLLLQLKKDWHWVQPPTMKGKGLSPEMTLAAILEAARAVPEAGIRDWSDVERLDIQPKRGLVKVQSKNRWEVQLDLDTRQVLHSAERRSDWIEALHDGSWFHDNAKYWVFLPTAVIVLGLWITGIYLFFLPWEVKWARRQREKQAAG
ncbi:MAG: PepSY domain-containing protein [Planctomycetia bacterium]|nr:PepSY domain-containing protein [Planctomycetia bacterium]